MSRRTYGANAFETTLTSSITAGSTSIPLATVTGLTAPGYLTINPFNASKREVLKFESINSLNVETLTRGLTGSSGGLAQANDAGTVVISTPVQQVIDDLFSDVEDLETFDTNHLAAADPHSAAGYLTQAAGDTRYINTTGDTMTGDLTLAGDPNADLKAAPKQYVDSTMTTHLAASNPHSTPFLVPFSSGDVVIEEKVGTGRLEFPFAATLISATVTLGVVATGQAVIVDVMKNGVTMFGGTKPQCAAGVTSGSPQAPTVSAIAIGDILTVNIDQVGTPASTAGENLTVILELAKA